MRRNQCYKIFRMLWGFLGFVHIRLSSGFELQKSQWDQNAGISMN